MVIFTHACLSLTCDLMGPASEGVSLVSKAYTYLVCSLCTYFLHKDTSIRYKAEITESLISTHVTMCPLSK